MDGNSAIPVYLVVVWHRGLPELDKVTMAFGEGFRVLKQFDVSWPRSHYIRNFAAFYGWKNYSMWFGKRNRSGTGTFRVMVIRDDHPEFENFDERLEGEPLRNRNVYAVKTSLRHTMRRSNVVHATVNEAETRQNLRALLGVSLEEFLARTDLDGSVETLTFTKPIPFVAYPYADEKTKGPRYLDGCLKFNRIDVYLLPRCGLPTVFSFSFRFFGVFSFAFCLGKIKIWKSLNP